MPEPAGDAPSILQVLRRNREVRHIWLAQLVSETGDWLTRVAVVSRVANEAQLPALALAGIQALMIAPYFLVSPFSGVLADRLPRRSVMLATDALAAVLVLAYLPALRMEPSNLSVALIGAIVFFHLALAGVFEASRTSLLAAVASPAELPAVNALSQITWSTCLALGSALGGVIVSTLGRDWAVMLDAASFAVGVAILAGLRSGRAPADRAPGGATRGGLHDFLAIFAHLRTRATTAAMLLPKFALGLVAMNDVAFALIGPREFGVSSEASFSAYLLGVGAGTAGGPFLANLWARSRPERMRIAIGVALLLEAALFSGSIVAPTLAWAATFAGAATAGGSTVWVFSTALVQRAAPDRLAGRLVALDFGLATGAMALSLLIGGALVDLASFTPRNLLVVSTCIYATGGLVWLSVVARFRGRAWDGDAGQLA